MTHRQHMPVHLRATALICGENDNTTRFVPTKNDANQLFCLPLG